MTMLAPQPPVVSAVFHDDETEIRPAGRFVHLALSVIADEHGHVETTVHTLEHMTGLLPTVIEAALGFNPFNKPLFPASVTLTDGVVVADLPTGA